MIRVLAIPLLLVAAMSAHANEGCKLEIKQTCDDAKTFSDYVNQKMTVHREGQRQRILSATSDDNAEILIQIEYLQSQEELAAVTKQEGITTDQLFDRIKSGQQSLACSIPVARIIQNGGKYHVIYHHGDGQLMLDFVISSCT